MQNWHDNVLRLIAEIDRCIRAREGETLTLAHLARLLDCSQSQVSHQFHALTGTSLRDFVQARRPALALPAVRDGEQRLLDIALDCGFSSQEAFTRAFRAAYGITPGEYRRSPRPLSLRTFGRWTVISQSRLPQARKTMYRRILSRFRRTNLHTFATTRASVTGILCKSSPAFPVRI